jgi:FdhD protein
MRPSKPEFHGLEVVDAATTVVAFDEGAFSPDTRAVPSEVPVNLVYGGIPFAVMMATPSDLEDFAIGFSLTEGIVKSPRDIRRVDVLAEERGLRLSIDLTSERLHEHLARKRALSGRTGCGLCGIDDLAALPHARPFGGEAPRLSPAAIHRALTLLDRQQPLNEITHAVHAAAWADLDGQVRVVREDVGRHNALDKLIGALCRNDAEPDQGFVLVTSRCSFELVEKVAAFGVRTLVAISAPTSLALERARHLDITLVGIARRDSMTVFHGLERIRAQDALP